MLTCPIGDEISEAMWEPSHPNRNEDCIRIEEFDMDTFLWADWNCDDKISYICELGTPSRTLLSNIYIYIYIYI